MYIDHLYNIIKEESEGFDTIYSDYIIHLIGMNGFWAMKSSGYLELCGSKDGRELYTLVEKKGSY